MQSRAAAIWEGSVREGGGRFTVGSGAFGEQQVTLAARTEGAEKMTTPEELIAAAHAACYAMAFSAALTRNETPPERLDVSAVCSLDRVEGALKISGIELTVSGSVPGVDPGKFKDLAKTAEEACPVSNALRGNVPIALRVE
jgi:osmotically inducible protein OsmC